MLKCFKKVLRSISKILLAILIWFLICIFVSFLSVIISYFFNVRSELALDLILGTFFIMLGMFSFSIMKSILKTPKNPDLFVKILMVILRYLGPLAQIILGISLVASFIRSIK